MPQVAIIIVNWNTGKLLARCLQALLELPEQDLISRVLIVDNASSDASMSQAETVIQHNQKFTFIRSSENLGFARANNIGMKRLGKENKDHILLLNPDTEMKPNSLRALMNALECNPAAGIIGPKLINADGSLQPSVRRFPTFSSLALLFLKLHHLFPTANDFDYSQEQTVDQVMGACFLVRRQTLQTLGSLDNRFWVWFEEVDFCRRARAAHWQTLYTPTATVMHHGGASFHQLVGWRKTMPFIRSALVYAKKHLHLPSVIGLYMLVPLALALTVPASIFQFMMQQKNKTRL